MVSQKGLRGYILEEVLAYLIKNTGYSLLVDQSQDPCELKNKSNGLVVKGRGGWHQADVLGELAWIPAFTFPIRLFVDAKYRQQKTGISSVRTAIGILSDINQNLNLSDQIVLTKRFSYNYALFSATGFSRDAVNMAIAHGISLVDLKGPDFAPILNQIDRVSTDILRIANILNENGSLDIYGGFVSNLRKELRYRFDTWPIETMLQSNDLFNEFDSHPDERIVSSRTELLDIIIEFTDSIKQIRELFVGMANGPYLLVLKANDPERFIAYSRQNPTHPVRILWSTREGNGKRWMIRPLNSDDYELTFMLPNTLGEYIFNSDNTLARAIEVKRRFFANLTIYRIADNRDQIIRLKYDPSDIENTNLYR